MKYVETRDFEKVDEVKRDVLALYRNDIRKYADNQATKVAAIFEEIPGQLQNLSCPHCIVKPVCVFLG